MTPLFHDTDMDSARAQQPSPVVATEPSPSVRSKKAIKRNANGDPVHSFAGLMDHLGSMPPHHAHATGQKSPLRPALPINAPSGGRIPPSWLRSKACPVTEKAIRTNLESIQSLAPIANANFGLAKPKSGSPSSPRS